MNTEFVLQEIEKLFADDFSGHDYWHTFRVYQNAMLIAKEESCDMEVVLLGALLHDVDDGKLFQTEDYANARKILAKLHTKEETVRQIIEVISQVSFKGKDTVTPTTIEGKIVQDADRLDAIGAIGAARTFAYGGSKGRSIHDPNIQPIMDMSAEEYRNYKSTSINHFYEKLFLLKDRMNTETGKRIAMERDRFMHVFVDEFLGEWNGRR